jgi:Protein of unknown function (DUF3237)
VLDIEVRIVLETDDKQMIYMHWKGFRHGPKDVIDRLNRGAAVDPSSYCFRITPYFETSSENTPGSIAFVRLLRVLVWAIAGASYGDARFDVRVWGYSAHSEVRRQCPLMTLNRHRLARRCKGGSAKSRRICRFDVL